MKLLFSIATVFMFLGFTVGSYGQALVYVTSKQTEPLAVGEQMHLNIQILGGKSVSGYEMTVGVDPTALRYIEGGNADYLPEDAFAIPPIATENTVYITATSGAKVALAREGTLATLTFEVVAAKRSTVELMDTILSDSAGMPLPVTSKNGRIVTIELPPNWDVNEDGRVNILDLTLVASNLNANAPVNPRVDVNKDGNVNILDLVLVAQNLNAAGGNEPEVRVKLVVPTFASLPPFERNIGFAAEEEAIRELYDVYATAHGDQDVDVLGDVWFKSESDDVFTAWTFWAGTFERNNGWKAVTAAWRGIFRLRQGAVTVNITYIAIDSRRKEAVLRGAYRWGGLQGDLISALQKDGSDWKIRAIDYTGGSHGKQIRDLIDPAHTFGEIPVVPPDLTSPEITGGTVFDGEEDVDPEVINGAGTIKITFSEEVSGNIALQTEAGDDVGWIGKVESTKGILELVKGKEIGNKTTYVIVGKVADAAGNETEVSITFTTKGKE